MTLNEYIQSITKKENKTEHLGDMRVTKELKEELQNVAKQNKISVAELVRILIRKGLKS